MKKRITTLMAVIAIALPLLSAFAAAKAPVEGVININTAPAEELMKLPGIGKSKAEAIVVYRQAHPFKSVEELTEVKGIGPKMLQKLQAHVTVAQAPGTQGTQVSVAAPVK